MLQLVVLALLAACGSPAPGATTATTADPEIVRFIAIGDSGRDTPTLHQVAQAIGETCAERGCDFGVILGDLLYDRGMGSADDPRMSAVTAPLAATGVRWYLAHGNHDYGEVLDRERAGWQRQWAQRTEGFELPAPWYAFGAGPADFWALNTPRAFWLGTEGQRDWLQAGLSSSTAHWKVAFGHHPLRSNGRHGNAGAYEGWVNLPWASGASVADLLEPLCGQADLYLSGHDHNLQLLDHCGVQLVVSGSAATVRELRGHGNRSAFERATAGFAWIELGRTGRVLFFDASGSLLHESAAIEPSGVLYSTHGPDGQHR